MSNKLLEQYYSQANIDINDVKYTFYDVYSVSIIPESDGDGCWDVFQFVVVPSLAYILFVQETLVAVEAYNKASFLK